MIVDDQTSMTPSDSPPSYDRAIQGEPNFNHSKPPQSYGSKPADIHEHRSIPGPSYTVAQPSFMPAPTVYHYVNPTTREQVTSLLPPHHPEMICLQAGMHEPQTKYGVLGVLAAIFWFPLGIGLCLLDRRVKCRRCGYIIDDGICG